MLHINLGILIDLKKKKEKVLNTFQAAEFSAVMPQTIQLHH